MAEGTSDWPQAEECDQYEDDVKDSSFITEYSDPDVVEQIERKFVEPDDMDSIGLIITGKSLIKSDVQVKDADVSNEANVQVSGECTGKHREGLQLQSILSPSISDEAAEFKPIIPNSIEEINLKGIKSDFSKMKLG